MDALLFLFKTFADLYLLVFLLRLILQWVRADFYNQFSQFVVKATDPLVVPARRILPQIGKIDTPTLVVLILLQCAVTYILLLMLAGSPSIGAFAIIVVQRLISLAIFTYTISIILYVVLSWVAPASYSPIAMVLGQVVNPILRPVRKILPTAGGFDLSPLIVIVLLQAAAIALGLDARLR